MASFLDYEGLGKKILHRTKPNWTQIHAEKHGFFLDVSAQISVYQRPDSEMYGSK